MKKYRININLKIILIVVMTVSVFLAVSVGLSNFCLFSSLRDNLMDGRRKMAQLMAGSIASLIDRQAELITINASAESLKEKEALANKTDRVLFEDAVFDESSGIWAFPLIVPVKDEEGKVIGAYKALVDISVFFKPLAGFKVGKGGKAALIDGRGYLLFYPGAKPFSNKLCEYDELQKLLKNERGWSIIDTVYMENEKTAVTFSPVTHPFLSSKGMGLYVVVTENSRGLFSPLNNLAVKMVIFSAILALAALILASVVFKRVFTGPIRELINGMGYLGDGRLDHRVDIKTGDEMGELATAFNEMAENLSHVTTPIKILEQERREYKIMQDRLEKTNLGLLSLLSQVRNSPKALTTDIMIKNLEKNIYASNLGMDRVEFKMRSEDLRDVIKESVFLFEPKIRGKGLDLRFDVPKSALTVYADKDKIRQVFDILIENSLKATEKGYIEISVLQEKDKVECSVSDTGIAIPKEFLSEVFERFGGFSRVKLQEGAWPELGLYIAKCIIEKHNGKIRVESISGDITRFVFSLPVSPVK